jgi:hypothetical protein
LFYGYCYYCSNFGHKAANCGIKFRSMQLRRSQNEQRLQHRTKQSVSRQRHNNYFDPLYNEPECYICHNFGHKALDCHLKNYKVDPRINSSAENVKIWKKKESNKCGLVLSAQRQKDPWYIDSGCSKHMTGDKSKFLSLSESKSGNVTFGNDAPGKIKGKGMVSLSNGKGKAQDVLFVDGLKHNLLSVSQVCDRGCEVVFTSKDCRIQSVNSGQLIAKGIRTENNVYVLKEEKEECHLSKYDESWLWHKRLGHLNFDHLIKLRNSGAVKDLPKISKPYDFVCKPCQIGKCNVPTLGHHHIAEVYDDQSSQMDVIASTGIIERHFGVHLALLIPFHHYDPFRTGWPWFRCIPTISMILSILSYKLIKFTEEVILGTLLGGTSQCNSSLESGGAILQDGMVRSDF